MRYQKLCLRASVAATLLAVPGTCFAAAGAQGLAAFIEVHLINQTLVAFWGVSAAAMFYYAVRMILESQSDQAYTDISDSFIYVFVGFSVIATASAFAAALFTPGLSIDPYTDVNPLIAQDGLYSVANFIITMSAGIFVLIVVAAGLRMVATQGDQGEFDKWKKLLVSNVIGVMIMFLAEAIVTGIRQNVTPDLLVHEMAGLAIFLLTLLGFLSVLALIVAGVLLIVSVEESLKDRAKRTVIGTLISLAIVLASYTLIRTFVPTPGAPQVIIWPF